MKKALKVLGVITLGLGVILGAFHVYLQDEQNTERGLELKYPGNAEGWEWYDTSQTFQSKISVNNELMLRKIYDNHLVQIVVLESGSLFTGASFPYDCQEDSVIDVGETLGDGTKNLYCNDLNGISVIQFGVEWPVWGGSTHWIENRGGFKVDEYFGTWPLDELRRNHAVRFATKTDGGQDNAGEDNPEN